MCLSRGSHVCDSEATLRVRGNVEERSQSGERFGSKSRGAVPIIAEP